MCGRFTHLYQWKQIHDQLTAFGIAMERALDGPEPSYNAPPKAMIPALRETESGLAAFFPQWWLVPHWSKTPDAKYATFNARSEDASKKPAFREPFRYRRCVIPASGFYEWKEEADGAKQPHYITRADGAPIYLAGLWDQWEDGTTFLESCTILTTTPNAEMSELHHRMPCVLEPERVGAWCARGTDRVDDVASFLAPSPDGTLSMRPVDRRVGNVRHNDPDLLADA
ncbi:MAG: SOS response-associated peptidase [Planctomycetota bacterium]